MVRVVSGFVFAVRLGYVLPKLEPMSQKTGKETAERQQVEDAINSVRAKWPEPILGHFDRKK